MELEISINTNDIWKLKTLPVASPPNTLTCAPSRSTFVVFFSLCFDSWSIWSRGWIVFCRCSDYTSVGDHNYVWMNDPPEWGSWEHFVIYRRKIWLILFLSPFVLYFTRRSWEPNINRNHNDIFWNLRIWKKKSKYGFRSHYDSV